MMFNNIYIFIIYKYIMGIEQFFSSLEKSDISKKYNNISNELKSKVKCTHFLMDFNSVIYGCSASVLNDLNYVIYYLAKKNYTDKKLNEINNFYQLQLTNTTSPYELKAELSQHRVDKFIIDNVINKIRTILNTKITSDSLQLLYISVDGVPLRSKVKEQRTRRNYRLINEEVKKKIFEKFENEMRDNEARYLFELNKINWSQSNISPGTEFMYLLHERLTNLRTEINDLIPSYTEYIYSSYQDIGEAEKKIVDYLRSTTQTKGHYIIYSPDGDFILLSLLVNQPFNPDDDRRITTLKLIRQTPQKKIEDVVHIDELADNIYLYIKTNIKKNINRGNVVEDMVFIMTLFGNDYVPKIISINVNEDFDKIIDLYIKLIAENNYLIEYDSNTKRKYINQEVFIKLIHLLKKNEGKNLQKVYMKNNYHNYKNLKKLFSTNGEDLIEDILKFLEILRSLDDAIVNNEKNDDIYKLVSANKKFLGIYKRVVNLDIKHNIDDKILFDELKAYYKNTNKTPQIKLAFMPYQHSIKDSYQRNKLDASLDYLGNDVKVTNYDIECYKFENMLDEYRELFDKYPLNIGSVKLDKKGYTLKYESIKTGVERFYKQNFGITNISIKNKKIQELVSRYLEGLVWVFELNYNRYNVNENLNKVDIWYYPYERAPLLYQIDEYLSYYKDTDIFKELNRHLQNLYLDKKYYFKPVELFIYISPAPYMLELIPKEYHDYIKRSKYYINIPKIVNDIINGINNILDCRGAIFANKCHLTIDYKYTDSQFLEEVRLIYPSESTNKINGIK